MKYKTLNDYLEENCHFNCINYKMNKKVVEAP